VSTGDGDTFRASPPNRQTITIRLGCVDAPESSQAWGSEAAQRLKQLLPKGQAIALRKIGTDRYGRVVAEVFVQGQSVGLQMVSQGLRSGISAVSRGLLSLS
jgi:micrococcal nuclease